MEFQDAMAIAEAIENGIVSAEEVVKESIKRIELENPRLNAVVYKQYEAAMKTAREGFFKDKLFSGVPILLKDLGQNQAGQFSSSGSRLFANHRASQTDAYVERLIQLGFIILGRTNTPEFGFKNISDSTLHGSVSLPQDDSRNAGGSSGGAAAAVAAGMVTIAGASDGGGSIRIPASFNGLIGLKPTRGRIPVGPSSYRGWQGASSQFALTKSVRDTRQFLWGMQTCQLESPFPLPLLSKQSIFFPAKTKLRIAYTVSSPIDSPVSKEAQSAVLEAVAYLKSLGHRLQEISQPILPGREVMQSYYLMNSVETAYMFDEIEKALGRPITIDDMEVMTWAIYRSGQKISAKQYTSILQDWDQYSAKMADFHTMYDILLTPTVSSVAPMHGQFMLSKPLQEQLRMIDDLSSIDQQDLIWEMFADSLAWTPFTQQANLTGQPAMSLPTYQTKDGLPIGVQLMAAKGREDLLLYLAEELETLGVLLVE